MVRIITSTLFIAALAAAPAFSLPISAGQPALVQRSAVPSESEISMRAIRNEAASARVARREIDNMYSALAARDRETRPLARRLDENSGRALTDAEARDLVHLLKRYDISQVAREYTHASRSRETDAATLLSSRFDSRSLAGREVPLGDSESLGLGGVPVTPDSAVTSGPPSGDTGVTPASMPSSSSPNTPTIPPTTPANQPIPPASPPITPPTTPPPPPTKPAKKPSSGLANVVAGATKFLPVVSTLMGTPA